MTRKLTPQGYRAGGEMTPAEMKEREAAAIQAAKPAPAPRTPAVKVDQTDLFNFQGGLFS